LTYFYPLINDYDSVAKVRLKTELPKFFATIFAYFSAYSCRKVSKNDKFAAKSNNFWEFMFDIVEKVLTLQRI
jgi:hypothetical protein